MKREISIIALLVLLTTVVSGCGQRQINDLALVSAVGLDVGSGSNTVRITAQIVRPADARGQTGAPTGGTGEPIYSASAEGRTIFEAIRNLARFSTRRVYWAHNYIIVMNEDYAKAGIADMIDFFTRNPELRMNTWVAVTPNKASEVVSTITGLEVVPGEGIDKLFRYSEILAEAPRTNMMRLQEAFLSPITHPVLPKLQLGNRGISNKKPQEYGSLKQVELSGSAVFKGDKMLGWLTPEQSRMAILFIGKVASGVMVIGCPDSSKQNITLEINRQTLKVKPSYEGGTVHFQLTVNTDASLVEMGCAKPVGTQMELLSDKLNKKVRKQLEDLLQTAQKKYKSDFLKLGETFHNEYPREWKKIADSWDDIFPNVKIDINVKGKVTNPVLKIKELRTS